MENIKYQVFISSTYNDLIEERRKALDVLLMADCIPAGMEAFVATDAEQFEVIKQVIDLCDYYVLIIGKRYGSISPNTGKSYTEMEYDYAISKDIPVLVFAINESVKLPDEKIDTDARTIVKLQDFREKAMKNRMVSIWATLDELTQKLAVSIMKAKTDIKRPGWKRGDLISEENNDIEILRSENNRLSQENESLKNTIEGLKKKLEMSKKDTLIAQKAGNSLQDVITSIEKQSITFEFCYYTDNKDQEFGEKCFDLLEIFKYLSIEMLDSCISEKKVDEVIKSKLFEEYKDVSFKDFQIIKILLGKLKSFDLIASQSHGKVVYWRLTEQGEKLRDTIAFSK